MLTYVGVSSNNSTSVKTSPNQYISRSAKGIKIRSELLKANVGGIPTQVRSTQDTKFKTIKSELSFSNDINYSDKLEVENLPVWNGMYTRIVEVA